MHVTVLTLFPEMFPGPLGHSLAGKALQEGIWSLDVVDIRDFATDKHATVDDRPYGGGTGMVMKADVIGRAIEHVLSTLSHRERGGASQGEGGSPTLIYFTPRGSLLTQSLVQELAQPACRSLVILCGRFEGIDERILKHYQMREISLGDYVLSGGELPALTLVDACIRLLPGVIGKESALSEESFAVASDYAGLLEYPHYTRPPLWNGLEVPEPLMSGDHARIRAWRRAQAETLTRERRPDLWERYTNHTHTPTRVAKKDEE